MENKKFNKECLLWTYDIEVIAGFSCIVATNKYFKFPNTNNKQDHIQIKDTQYLNGGLVRFFEAIRQETRRIIKENNGTDEDVRKNEPILNGFNNYAYDNIMVNKMIQVTQRDGIKLPDLRRELKQINDDLFKEQDRHKKLTGFSKREKKLNYSVIAKDGKSKKVQLNTFDIYDTIDRGSNASGGLKKHQACNGLDTDEGGLHDLIDKVDITDEQRTQILRYCVNDVYTTQTIHELKTAGVYNTVFDLIETIIKEKHKHNDNDANTTTEASLLGKTQANLTNYILSNNRENYNDKLRNRYFTYEDMLRKEKLGLREDLMKTANTKITLKDFPDVITKDKGLKAIADQYIGKTLFELDEIPKSKEMLTVWDEDNYFKKNLKGDIVKEQMKRGETPRPTQIDFTIGDYAFGKGGVHMTHPDKIIFHNVQGADVISFYPSTACKYKVCQPKNLNVEMYYEMLVGRMKFKKTDPAKANLYKLILNMMFGTTRGNPSLALNDPKAGLMICIICQILIYKLARDISRKGAVITQVNTDGVYFTYPKGCTQAQKQDILNTKKEWEDSIHADAKPGEPKKIMLDDEKPAALVIQKSVNEYLMFDENGELIKGKGTDYKTTFLEKGSGSKPPVAFKMFIAELLAEEKNRQAGKIVIDPKEAVKQEYIKCSKDLKDFQLIQSITRVYTRTELTPIKEMPPLTPEQKEGKSPKQIIDLEKKRRTPLTKEEVNQLPREKLELLEKETKRLNPHINRVFLSKNAQPVMLTKVKKSDGKKDVITRSPSKFTIENGDLNNLSPERKKEIMSSLDFKAYRDIKNTFKELWTVKRSETELYIEKNLPKLAYDEKAFNAAVSRFEKDILSKTSKIIELDKNKEIILDLKELLKKINTLVKKTSSEEKSKLLELKKETEQNLNNYILFEKQIKGLHQENLVNKKKFDDFYNKCRDLYSKFNQIYKSEQIFKKSELTEEKIKLDIEQKELVELINTLKLETTKKRNEIKKTINVLNNTNQFYSPLVSGIEKKVFSIENKLVKAQKKSQSKER